MYIILKREKVIKKSQNSRNKGFSYYFCFMMEGSGDPNSYLVSDTDLGGPKTSGSGKRRLISN